MFKIGDFSKLCRVPASMLRYYAKLGLFEPEVVDPFTGYRYYSLRQLPQLNRVLALRDLGLSLNQVAQLLDGGVDDQALRDMLKIKQAELSQEMADVEARLARVSARIRLIEQENTMPDYEVITKSVDPFTVASIREVVPTLDQMPERCRSMFEAIGAWLPNAPVQPYGPGIAIYHIEEYVERDIDVENGIVVKAGDATQDTTHVHDSFTIQVHQLPAIEVASVVHHGDYDRLTEAWQAIGRWIEENGYTVNGPPREIYLTRPGEPPVTEIQFPVTRCT